MTYKKIPKLFSSLQTRLVIVIISLLFLPLLITINIGFQFSEGILHEKIVELQKDNLNQIAINIETMLLDMVKLMNVLGTNEIIHTELSGTHVTSPGKFSQAERFKRMVTIERQILYSKAGIFFNYDSDVLLIADGGMVYNVTDSYDGYSLSQHYPDIYIEKDFTQDILQGERSIIWTAPFEYGLLPSGTDQKFISAARGIFHPQQQDLLGILMINISEKSFLRVMSNQEATSAALFSDTNEVIFELTGSLAQDSRFKADQIDTSRFNGRSNNFIQEIGESKFLLSSQPLRQFGWNIVSLYPYERITSEINYIRARTLYLTILLLLLFTCIALVFFFRILTPLKQFMHYMKNIKIYDQGLQEDEVQEIDDIGWIIQRFHYLLNRLQGLSNQVIEEQKHKHELRYQALLAQVTPHFLFNTLDHIKWTAMINGATHVSSMLSSLGHLLEHSINRGDEEIPLSKELELVNSFLYIQRSRLNRHIEMEFLIDAKAEESRVLKFILQPIVENCLIHGFKHIHEGFPKIRISAQPSGSDLLIQVADNGIGMDQTVVDEVKANDSYQNDSKFSGIGLPHTHHRIRLHYGPAYGLSVLSEEGWSTVIEIRIPWRKYGTE